MGTRLRTLKACSAMQQLHPVGVQLYQACRRIQRYSKAYVKSRVSSTSPFALSSMSTEIAKSLAIRMRFVRIRRSTQPRRDLVLSEIFWEISIPGSTFACPRSISPLVLVVWLLFCSEAFTSCADALYNVIGQLHPDRYFKQS